MCSFEINDMRAAHLIFQSALGRASNRIPQNQRIQDTLHFPHLLQIVCTSSPTAARPGVRAETRTETAETTPLRSPSLNRYDRNYATPEPDRRREARSSTPGKYSSVKS